MPPAKRKFGTTTPTRPTQAVSSSASSRGSYRTQWDSEDEDISDSSRRGGKRAKLSRTPASTGKGRGKPNTTRNELDEIDFLAHPETPEPTPSKTTRTKTAKTPKTAKRTTSNLVIVSRSQVPGNPVSTSAARAIASSPSKSQRRTISPSKLVKQPVVDADRTLRAEDFEQPSDADDLDEIQIISSSLTRPAVLKPAVPGAARGRKKIPGRQLVRGDGSLEASSSHAQPETGQHRVSPTKLGAVPAAGRGGAWATGSDDDDDIPQSSRVFLNPRGVHSIKKPTSTRTVLSSPSKRRLANGDTYVEYMVPMSSGDNDGPRGGMSSGDEGAYISTSASEAEVVEDSEDERRRPRTTKGKGRAPPHEYDSYSVSSRPPPTVSRSSSASRPVSPSNYTTSSPYTSRGPSPSPSFPRSGAVTSNSESESEDSLYEHQHHVNPTRNLDKLASLARMALAAAEDMRKKGLSREDEPPLPKSFLTGVVLEKGTQRKKRPDASPSKKGKAKETDGEDGEETMVIRALPERRLGQMADEPLVRSRSWMDTVLGPTGAQSQPQASRAGVLTDTENPFDNAQSGLKRTNSQPLINHTNTYRPEPPRPLVSTHSEPSLETVLAAYDMTPSRSRTMHINMTPSKSRILGNPSRSRLFGTPSRTARMKELEEEDESHVPSQEFDAWLASQQMLVLKALRDPVWAAAPATDKAPEESQLANKKDAGVWVEGEKDETEAVTKLRALLRRTVETGEGNSCLLVGPRGSGKTRTVNHALQTLIQAPTWKSAPRPSTPPPPSFVPETPSKHVGKVKRGAGRALQRPRSPTPPRPPPPPNILAPIVIRLSGHAQTNDRLAMREIARQLVLQSGEALQIPLDDDPEAEGGPAGVQMPTATHLPQIVGALARQVKPVIVVLDGFDLFAEHARQALLYCLLDTVQSCRAGEGSRGLAVVGMTSRIDCLTMLEKRVKSRFSHRIIRVSPPVTLDSYMSLVHSTMTLPEGREVSRLQSTLRKKGKLAAGGAEHAAWQTRWKDAVDRVLSDRQFKQVLEDTFELSRDVRLLLRILSGAVANLTPTSPWLTVGGIARSIQAQCITLPFAFLQELAYPCIALLVATQHIHDRGHDVFTFRMLCAEIKRELGNEAVTKALVQMQGRGLGLIRVPEPVLETAFESLVAHKVLVLAGPASNSTGRVFVKYRCVPERSDVKDAVERLGHSALKRWFVQGASN